MAAFHWYVSAYRLSFEDYSQGGIVGPLCKDEPKTAAMFRVVFKSNLTRMLAANLFERLNEVVETWKEEHRKKVSTLENVAPEDRSTIRSALSHQRRSSVRALMHTQKETNVHAAC